jgi:serine phosphatase RsbU (regulator of sigma subunit)
MDDDQKTLKENAHLLLRRERELFALRRKHEHVASWLHLALSVPRLIDRTRSRQEIYAGLRRALIAGLKLQRVEFLELHEGALRPVGSKGAGRAFGDEAARAVDAAPAGLCNHPGDPGLEALAEAVGLHRFVWSRLRGPGGSWHLLVGGFDRERAVFHAPFEPDTAAHIWTLSQHIETLLENVFLVNELEGALAQIEETVRLRREIEIGTHIQSAILPARIHVPGLEIAACMKPATEIGGDYYDVLGTADGAFIGIGDVAGHGLGSGLVMLMLQSAVSALCRARPDALPSEILVSANEVLVENIRDRLRQDEHVTLSLLRYRSDGHVVFAGAHEELVIWRTSIGRCELVATPGTWLGARRDIRAFLVDSTFWLAEGDVLVLYTDGVTEARDATRRPFGLDRLCQVVDLSAGAPAETIRDRIVDRVEAWSARREDDLTVIVLRRLGA